MTLTYLCGERDADRKVYHVLKNELRLSAEQIKRAKRVEAVAVDGTPVWTDRRLVPGETVTVALEKLEAPPDFPPEQGPVEVIFENEALLALNKPAGLLTHPSKGKFTGTLANFAAGYLLDTADSAVCHAVNRLDRDTSGVVLFAKSAYYKNLAIEALRAPEAEKEYIAFLRGRLPEKRGVIELPIAREREGCQRRVVRCDGKPAVTEYETVETARVGGAEVSLARLRLKTGRTHQIRVHCAYLGAPVLGDRLYGDAESVALAGALGLTAHLLHAGRLTFREGLSGETISLRAEIRREDMIKIGEFFKNFY